MKVLIDTNVLLSAALRNRLPELVVKYVAVADDSTWIVTPTISNEYIDVLRHPKFRLDANLIVQWIDLLSMRAIDIGNPPLSFNLPRDPKDSPFLAAALFSEADFLITGDQDLLSARGLVRTQIVTVAEFAAKFLPPQH